MLTLCAPEFRLHESGLELIDGVLAPSHESPARAERILQRIHETGLGPVEAPSDAGPDPLLRVHSAAFLDFLEHAHERWTRTHTSGAALGHCWPARHLAARLPEEIDGQLGFYGFDAGTPITAGAWAAAYGAAQAAAEGAVRLAAGAKSIFALCRPPGHHAAAELFGGYCYLNNAAIAAERLRDSDAEKVAILDIDYHHGNGTQDIFYARDDVFFTSIHADPAQDFPYFAGFADERGAGRGEGCNLNLPLRWGAGWPTWSAALDVALAEIRHFAADALIVSLGVDTFRGDPLSRFDLESEHFRRIGARIAGLCLPTLFVMEGGYESPELGVNVVNVLAASAGR